jgi:hypothetical protein
MESAAARDIATIGAEIITKAREFGADRAGLAAVCRTPDKRAAE